MYSHVDAIEVSIWGRHVGTIVPRTATHYRVEYDPAFLRSGIEIAPFELPLFGRSITYRFGTFQGLALAALLGRENYPARPGAVRGALTAVLRRQTGPENFLPGGWLRVGFNGEQQMLAEGYIDYGSVYMCAAVFLPLGLPATDVFWAEPESDWTQRAAWSGRPARIDHRL